jgi:hypothetical protein
LAAIIASSLLGYDTCIWGVSPIFFICRSFQALSGWMHSYFQVSPEMFDRLQVQALAGPFKDIQRLGPKPHLSCHGCVLRVVVLLEGKPSPQSEVLSFHQGSRCTFLLSSFPRSYYKGVFLWWKLCSPNFKLTCCIGFKLIVQLIHLLNFKKIFGHFSCDTNLIKTYRLWARLHEVCNYDLKKSQEIGFIALLHTNRASVTSVNI